MKPGIEDNDWGLETTVTDPFGNRIRFMEPKKSSLRIFGASRAGLHITVIWHG